MHGIAALLHAHNARHDRPVLLVVDEVYRRLVYPPHEQADVLAEYEHTVYLWLRSPWPDALELVDELARRHVLLTPGIAFGGESHVRLCSSAPRHKLTTAMDVLAELARERISA